MRKLTPDQVKLISDAVNENLTLFSPGALEKDIHLTEVLRSIANVESEEFQLVFCGGTSLVKAYGCLNRMSEDIDIKVVGSISTNTSANRSQLNKLRARISKSFLDAAFEIETFESKNSNKFMVFNLKYEPAFPREVSLRAEIRVEFTHTHNQFPIEILTINTILLRDLQRIERELQFPCVSLEQTLAEKIVSFLRRFRNTHVGEVTEDTLVRHIHDVHILANQSLNLAQILKAFNLAIQEDRQKFINQDLTFSKNPKSALLAALVQAQTNRNLEISYERFVVELVAGQAPTFKQAFTTFTLLAQKLIDSLD